MSRLLALAHISALLFIATLRTEADAQDRPDRFGDALPDHAVARMGSLRFNLGSMVHRIAFTADSKKVLVNGWGRNRLFDCATGKEHGPITIMTDSVSVAGNRFLAVADGAIRDLESCEAICAIDAKWRGGAVAPNGKIAVLHQQVQNLISSFSFVDMTTGDESAPVQVEGVGQVDLFQFSADSRRLITLGLTGGGQSFTGWEIPAAKLLRRSAVNEHPFQWRACLAPDGKTIANIKLDSATKRSRIDVHDFETLKVIASFAAPAKTSLNAVAVAPGGKLVAGASQSRVFLWDTATGKEVRQFHSHGSIHHVIQFSPDGKTLAVGESNWITLYDVATGLARHQLGHTYAIFGMLFEPAGEKLYSFAAAFDPVLRVWNPRSGEQVQELKGHTAGLSSLAMSADGRLLATSSQDRTIRVWERESRKQRLRLDQNEWGHTLGFLPDGKQFVSARRSVRLHDVNTGQVLRSFDAPAESTATIHRGTDLWWQCFDPKSFQARTLQVMDLSTAKLGSPISADGGSRHALSPDGRCFALGLRDGKVRLIDSQTGRQLEEFAIADSPWTAGVAFSADGALLAVGARGGDVCLLERATGKERCRLKGHRDDVFTFAFSPDRTLLATAGSDRTIVTWDLYGKHLGKPTKIAPDEVEKLWRDLGSVDAALAYAAIKRFVGDGATAVALFKSKHRTPPRVPDEQLRGWIAALGSENFKVREDAQRNLKPVVRQAAPLLEAALAKNDLTLEATRRVQQLLDELNPARSSESLRWARAEEVLRVLATPDAFALLKQVSER
jgi:WD40 repeat protein